ncbi:DUF4811 domain-containing protein [Leuconostoc litchii]|uniref:DUF4811 domain-containing protein n=1 Tax=Leuconostoc litchii TaxID=1981069 RepID=A0A6P2CQ62_9LACO|nr:DUF4811 domain-containing protein [Leuconostoc litchii]TYC46360.1 DUF4811 domain-containing protein [Leuconostoc litchii]
MIILIMAIFAILAFLANMMLENRIIRITTTAVMFVGLIISVIGIIANMHDHYGMKQVTTTEKKQIYTAGGANQGFGILLYQGIGSNGEENVYIYKHSAKTTKNYVAKPNLKTTSSRQSISGNKAYKITKTTRWVYKNNTYKLLFGIADNNKTVKHRHTTYQVPETWVALTTTQAKSLSAKMAPKNDAEKIAAAEKQKQLSALAQTNPDKAAQLQVQAIKAALNIKGV